MGIVVLVLGSSGSGKSTSLRNFDENEIEILNVAGNPLLCLEGVPDLPVTPQDEAGLTKTFQTWPRGWFHIP